MIRMFYIRGVMCSALLALVATMVQAQTLDEALSGLKTYKFGESRAALAVLEDAALNSAHDPSVSQKLEAPFVALLGSDASVDAKRFVCRQLGVIGTAASVDALAALIGNADLADYAIRALVSIPDNAALVAMLKAVVDGPQTQKVNVIHGIARRGSEDAVTAMAALVDNPDKAIAQAAIAALGSIGGTGCTALLEALAKEGAKADAVLADACIQCGDWMPESRKADALTIYNTLSDAAQPGHIRAAALSGLVRLEPENAEAYVVKAISDPDPALVQVASGFIRELPGDDAAKTFAAMLAEAPAQSKILIIEGLAFRGATVALGEISDAAQDENEAVQLAALRALGRLGNQDTAAVLVDLSATSEGKVQRTARASLKTIPGKQVDVAVLKIAQSATGAHRLEAINALAGRRALRTVPALLTLAENEDAAVRDASLKSLRILAGEEDMAALLALFDRAPDDAQRKNISSTVVELAGRIRAEGAKTALVTKALATSQQETSKAALIGVLGRIATNDALAVVRKQVASDKPALKAAAVNALAAWPDARPLADLKTIAADKSDDTARAIAFNGYIRQLRTAKTINAAAKLEAYKVADTLATGDQEKKLVISALSEVPSLEALEYVEARQQDPAVAAEATQAVIKIAGGISGAYRDEVARRMNAYIQQDTSETVKKLAQNVLNGMQGREDDLTAWQFAGPYFKEGKPASTLCDMQFKAETDPANATWSIVPMGLDRNRPWIVSLARALGGVQRMVYLRTTITSHAAQDVILEFGSNDGAKVWWNGQLIHQLNVGRPLNPGQDKLPVSLKAGDNTLVVAVYQHGGDWGMTGRLRTKDGKPVEGVTQSAK
ncbi:MAG: HEAT repeat domain-containing protein [Candidatus Hydrogenedentes bacterium]|nr:HEAT repeat domain-containing protein [Candidatus Hydrogenedentota bacterium]